MTFKSARRKERDAIFAAGRAIGQPVIEVHLARIAFLHRLDVAVVRIRSRAPLAYPGVEVKDLDPHWHQQRLGLRIIILGDISGPLSSCRGPPAALKCPYHRDRVTRH